VTASTLSERDAAALVRGEHGDPFSVLGPHPVDGGARWVVRALLPDAREAFVVAGSTTPMRRLDDVGLFEAVVDGNGETLKYELRVLGLDGRERRVRDPFSFGSQLSSYDLHLFCQGDLRRLYDHLGAHPRTVDGVAGVHFAVWAPNARRVSVVGDFNGWDGRYHPMRRLVEAGVFEIFIPGLRAGALYRYEVLGAEGSKALKSDPLAFQMERPPKSASIVADLGGYAWSDDAWIERRSRAPSNAPMSIYEVHLGSWVREPKEGNRSLSYRELAERLPPYVERLGFTHVELLPVAEHPFFGSWGYQVTGYYAATARYGSPHDLMALVDAFHRRGIGVILDWAPAHFPTDAYGLARFDGTALYEHLDPRQGFHQDWKTYIFNYGRKEVSNFLVANALFWIEKYHIDGLRVDAVSSMLYLDYSRKEGEWVPNRFGGRENLDAIEFVRRLNTVIGETHPGAMVVAEESTAFPAVTRPVHLGGLGFSFKWKLGWMHDSLDFFSQDPIHRRHHTGLVTFSMWYAYAERYILVISHDEVVHGKGSLLGKMPGNAEQKAANVRALLAMMFTHPGRKLLFMGAEIGQWREWNHDDQLQWELLERPLHAGLQKLVIDLNRLYRNCEALSALDESPEGFQWVDFHDLDATTFSWLRLGPGGSPGVLVAANLTPVSRRPYRIGAPRAGYYRELLNTDASVYGGSNVGNQGGVGADLTPLHGQPCSITVTLPPLSVVCFEIPADAPA
jgi:1,4-alpha-glucan branching enzyme